MDHLVASIEWQDGPYLLLRMVGGEGGRLVPARLGSPADERSVLREIADHPEAWISNRMVLFKPGAVDGSGVLSITLLRPDGERPGHFILMRDEPMPPSFFGNILVLICILLALGIRQARAQRGQKYTGPVASALDVRQPRFRSLLGSFLRQSFGMRPGDWSSMTPPKAPEPAAPDASPSQADDDNAPRPRR